MIATCTCTILDEISIFYTDCNIHIYTLCMSIFWYDDDIGLATTLNCRGLVVPVSGPIWREATGQGGLKAESSGWIKMVFGMQSSVSKYRFMINDCRDYISIFVWIFFVNVMNCMPCACSFLEPTHVRFF